MDKTRRNQIISSISIMVIIVSVAVIFWPRSISPLEEEFEWFRQNGYNTSTQKYVEYLEGLPLSYVVDEIKLSKTAFRAKAEYLEQNHLTYKIKCCTDMNMLYIAQPSEQENTMTIYYWES